MQSDADRCACNPMQSDAIPDAIMGGDMHGGGMHGVGGGIQAFLGDGFRPRARAEPLAPTALADRWILSRLAGVVGEV